MSWSPPSDGTPCWINLLATDVPRARKFWSEAMGWKFRDGQSGPDGRNEDPNHIAHIESFKDCPGGGITKTSSVLRTEGKGGTILYLYVNDLEETEKKVVGAGGKKMTDIIPEGTRAFMQHFEDTEGNYFGTYSMKKE